MAFTAAKVAGDELTASHLAARFTELTPLVAVKSADETVTTSTALQNDDELFVSVAASTTYEVFLRLVVNTSATADFKYTFTVPASATGSLHLFTGSNPDTAASGLQGPSSITATGAASGVGADQVLIIQGILVVSSTAGTLQFQWAQNTSNLSTIVRGTQQSYLILRKIV